MARVKRNLTSSKSKTSLSSHGIQKEQDIPDVYDRQFQCPNHPACILNCYCSFCEKPVCEKCKSLVHARHSTELKGRSALIRAAKYRRKVIHKMLDNRNNSVIPRIKALIIEICDSKAKLHDRVENVKIRYESYANKHRDKLVTSEEEFIGELMSRSHKYYDTMDEKITFLKNQLLDVEMALRLIQNQLDSACHAELLLIFNSLRTSLESLHEPIWPCEEILVTIKLETVPVFGAVHLQTEKQRDTNCIVTFDHEIVDPVIYSRIFDTRLPIPKKAFADELAKVSLSSASHMYAAFGEYILTYTLDSRRRNKARNNIYFTTIMTVRDNIIDISCDHLDHLFYLTQKSVNSITVSRKILKCFSIFETPSAMCVTRDGHCDIYVAFHDAGKILKYDIHGKILMELSHHDPRMVYRARHLTLNHTGDIFFSDDISNITILDRNGIWKSAINRDVMTVSRCGPLRPSGIACSNQRHVFILDSNATPNVHIFSEEGKYLQTAVFKNLKDAYILDIDRSGDLWIAFKDGRLRVYRPSFMKDLNKSSD